MPLKTVDKVVFYTDGIVEAVNEKVDGFVGRTPTRRHHPYRGGHGIGTRNWLDFPTFFF